MKSYSLYFGQAYGSGSYGSGTYSCTTQQQQAGTCNTSTSTGTTGGNSSGTGGGSGLTNTGIGILAIVTLACLIIFVSLVVRIWRRKPATVPVETEETETAQIADDENSDR